MYDILLKNGRVIDPSQGIHAVTSVAIKDGKIAALKEDISEIEAKTVFNMKGTIVTRVLSMSTAILLQGSCGWAFPQRE